MKVYRQAGHGFSDRGWLQSKFHFSFADYYNPERIQFGHLRVINDDWIKPGAGFELHPHRDMEIISYVIEGELTHADSMGNNRRVKRGEVQYMSAGTGVLHSEHNRGPVPLHLLQIWVLPNETGLPPNYGDHRFNWDERHNRWLHLVSPIGGTAPVQIHQDVNFYATELEAGHDLTLACQPGRQIYLVQIEGEAEVNGRVLKPGDGAELVGESARISAQSQIHLLALEMAVIGEQ